MTASDHASHHKVLASRGPSTHGVMVVPGVFSAILAAVGSYMIGYSAVAMLTLLSGMSFLGSVRRPRSMSAR